MRVCACACAWKCGFTVRQVWAISVCSSLFQCLCASWERVQMHLFMSGVWVFGMFAKVCSQRSVIQMNVKVMEVVWNSEWMEERASLLCVYSCSLLVQLMRRFFTAAADLSHLFFCVSGTSLCVMDINCLPSPPTLPFPKLFPSLILHLAPVEAMFPSDSAMLCK